MYGRFELGNWGFGNRLLEYIFSNCVSIKLTLTPNIQKILLKLRNRFSKKEATDITKVFQSSKGKTTPTI